MKKRLLAVIMAAAMMFSLVGCTPNMKAYMAETEKVAEWKGSEFTGKMSMEMEVAIDEEGNTEKIAIPMEMKGKAEGQDKVEMDMVMDMKAIKAMVPAEEAEAANTIPDTINFKMFADADGKAYLKKDTFVNLLGEAAPEELKNIKEEYIALDAMSTMNFNIAGEENEAIANLFSKETMDYLNSEEADAEAEKIMEAMFKDFKPTVDMKVDGRTYSYEINSDQMVTEFKGVMAALKANWANTSTLMAPMLEKMGMEIDKAELDNAFAEFDQAEFDASLDEVKEAIKGSKFGFTSTFEDDKVVEKVDMVLNFADMFKITMNVESTTDKDETIKITMPTSVKTVTMEEWMNMFMTVDTEVTPGETVVLIRYNGEFMEFEDQQPVVKENRTLVPFRGLLEKMGAEVEWDAVNRTVRANKDGVGMVFEVGNKTALVGENRVDMDVPAQIINNRTMIPIRFVSENLGFKVEFDNSVPGVYLIDIYNITEAELEAKINEEVEVEAEVEAETKVETEAQTETEVKVETEDKTDAEVKTTTETEKAA
ncbi:copper amine oxidase N-terminal domain-containing protein [Anaerosphaera multitolerans]|uniref:Copper amine oxidase N-terminal domain-containing protein n=1 Tax=Anaerosphaera multitolerans TaxID=2487351 RepID=A0A437S8X5_9FIRM|nr:copper amine oxidase N-terminal domain-containing protein [Anaerosphaera multitolerans]RVU55560.1 copper amine oxidase N-terminal domain-containing protein [Anaerosphaera multitolerans]